MKKTSESERGILLPILKAQIVWIVSGAILLLIFSAVAFTMGDPSSVLKPLALTALYMSVAIGGIGAARGSEKPLFSGVLSGVVSAAIVFSLSLLPLYDSGFEFGKSIILTLLIVPAALVGAIVGRPRAKSTKKRRVKKIKSRR